MHSAVFIIEKNSRFGKVKHMEGEQTDKFFSMCNCFFCPTWEPAAKNQLFLLGLNVIYVSRGRLQCEVCEFFIPRFTQIKKRQKVLFLSPGFHFPSQAKSTSVWHCSVTEACFIPGKCSIICYIEWVHWNSIERCAGKRKSIFAFNRTSRKVQARLHLCVLQDYSLKCTSLVWVTHSPSELHPLITKA